MRGVDDRMAGAWVMQMMKDPVGGKKSAEFGPFICTQFEPECVIVFDLILVAAVRVI